MCKGLLQSLICFPEAFRISCDRPQQYLQFNITVSSTEPVPGGAMSQIKTWMPTSGGTGLSDADVHSSSKESRHHDDTFQRTQFSNKIYRYQYIESFTTPRHPRTSRSSIIVEVQHQRIAPSCLLIRSPTVLCINRLIINYHMKSTKNSFPDQREIQKHRLRCQVISTNR
jgi:hypothetical protein